jgi:hypothetical protein
MIVLGATLFLPSVFAAPEVNGTGNGNASCFGFVSPATISFSANAGSKTIAGSGTITYLNPMNMKAGSTSTGSLSFTSGSISSKGYTLTGQESFSCFLPGQPFPFFGQATATVSGSCGAGVSITFSNNQGDRGTFTGNVACSA